MMATSQAGGDRPVTAPANTKKGASLEAQLNALLAEITAEDNSVDPDELSAVKNAKKLYDAQSKVSVGVRAREEIRRRKETALATAAGILTESADRTSGLLAHEDFFALLRDAETPFSKREERILQEIFNVGQERYKPEVIIQRLRDIAAHGLEAFLHPAHQLVGDAAAGLAGLAIVDKQAMADQPAVSSVDDMVDRDIRKDVTAGARPGDHMMASTPAKLQGIGKEEYMWVRGSAAMNAMGGHDVFRLGIVRQSSVRKIQQLFDEADRTHRGHMSLPDFKSFLSKRAPHLSRQAASLFHTMDPNDNGFITFRQLLALLYPGAGQNEIDALLHMVKARDERETVTRRLLEDVESVFAKHDKGSKGMLPAREILMGLMEIGYEEREAKEVVDKVTKGSGVPFSLAEFKEWRAHTMVASALVRCVREVLENPEELSGSAEASSHRAKAQAASPSGTAHGHTVRFSNEPVYSSQEASPTVASPAAAGARARRSSAVGCSTMGPPPVAAAGAQARRPPQPGALGASDFVAAGTYETAPAMMRAKRGSTAGLQPNVGPGPPPQVSGARARRGSVGGLPQRPGTSSGVSAAKARRASFVPGMSKHANRMSMAGTQNAIDEFKAATDDIRSFIAGFRQSAPNERVARTPNESENSENVSPNAVPGMRNRRESRGIKLPMYKRNIPFS
ncbi:unnamed protein product [Pedinophyceae sp. YPF-701]|nr:unnamed protein product [Pedinophyceae sp. YPF-701]